MDKACRFWLENVCRNLAIALYALEIDVNDDVDVEAPGLGA